MVRGRKLRQPLSRWALQLVIDRSDSLKTCFKSIKYSLYAFKNQMVCDQEVSALKDQMLCKNVCEARIEKSIAWDHMRHYLTSLVMPNSGSGDIFSIHSIYP